MSSPINTTVPTRADPGYTKWTQPEPRRPADSYGVTTASVRASSTREIVLVYLGMFSIAWWIVAG